MNVVIIGATGGTGSQLLKQALAAGHRVCVLVRDPSKIRIASEQLSVVKGDVLDRESVAAAIASNDHVVLSALGVMHPLNPTTVLSVGTQNILAAMDAARVSRFVCLSAAGMHVDSYDSLFLRFAKSILKRVFRELYSDLERMEIIVQKSGAQYTIVLPPQLTNGPLNETWRTALDHNLPGAWSISRSSLANCMLKIVEDRNTFRHAIYVG